MRSPADHVRHALEAHALAQARSQRGVAASADEDLRALTRARRALGTGEVREALASAVAMGLVESAEHAALLGLQAAAAREEVWAQAGIAPDVAVGAHVIVDGEACALGALVDRCLEEDGARAARALLALGDAFGLDRARRAEAFERAASAGDRVQRSGPGSADAGPDDLASKARAFSASTDDLVRDALGRAAHALALPAPRSLREALRVLRAPTLDGFVPARDRPRRVASLVGPLGFHGLLSARVTLGSPHTALDPAARVVALDPPWRIVVRPSSLALGLGSELAMARGLGEALGRAMVAPSLPSALRRARPGSVAQGLGSLLAGLHLVPSFWASRGLAPKALEAAHRASVAVALAHVRVLAAGVLASEAGRDRVASAREGLARALGLDDASMPEAVADPRLGSPTRSASALRAALAAPGIAMALRARFDEDWWRNPRAGEPLLGAGARGGTLSVESWAEELGASGADSLAWWFEVGA